MPARVVDTSSAIIESWCLLGSGANPVESNQQPEVLDRGHKYRLLTLDGALEQTLTFVKRFDPNDPTRFPGNHEAYPGTTMQSVIRFLIERIDYLQNQIPDGNNVAVRQYLVNCLWLLEDRAARRHGYDFDYRPDDMLEMPMCPHCGHVVCKELGNAKRL